MLFAAVFAVNVFLNAVEHSRCCFHHAVNHEARFPTAVATGRNVSGCGKRFTMWIVIGLLEFAFVAGLELSHDDCLWFEVGLCVRLLRFEFRHNAPIVAREKLWVRIEQLFQRACVAIPHNRLLLSYLLTAMAPCGSSRR